MASFRYTAADNTGGTVGGRIEAISLAAAGQELDRRGLIPLKLKPIRSAGERHALPENARWRIEDKILFTQKFASLIKAGIPLLTVLGLVARQTKDQRVAAAVQRIADGVAGGRSLHEAMAQFPRLFDPLYLGAVKTGEATGRLESVLDLTSIYLEREMSTRRKVKEALRYPVMVVAALVIACGVILKFVVPRFMTFYGNFGAELPGPTRFLIAAADVFGRIWWLMPIVAVVLWVAWRAWMKTDGGRWWRDRTLLRIPLLGLLILKVAVSRFSRLFGVLYSAGVPATTALKTVAAGVGNVAVAADIDGLRRRITSGESPGTIPEDAVMPELVFQMIGIGFESGEVDRMMSELARHYEQEIDYDVRRLTDRLQPILLAFMAAGVLVVALAVLLPMWNLISIFKQ